MVLQIAIYGKGGVGKSTIATNIAAALAEKGYRVLVVGCDPKHDCTRNLRRGRDIPTILDTLRRKGLEKMSLEELVEGKKIELEEVVFPGSLPNVYVAEAGGPKPGHGCAGRGVILAIETLKKLDVFRRLNIDIAIYDVLGDVVCGGFAMPLRMGLANAVYIVTSADYMSLYAANNICRGIVEFASRGGSKLGGLIYNVRSPMLDEEEIVYRFAKAIGAKVIGKIPYSHIITEAEIEGMTVIEYAPDSDIANVFRELAHAIVENREVSIPKPLSHEELSAIGRELSEKLRRKIRAAR